MTIPSPMPHPHGATSTASAGADLADASAAVILLHGRGATAHSMLDFAEVLQAPGLAFLAPQAATNSWYPHSFLAPIASNRIWLESALARIGTLWDSVSAHGIPDDRILLLGFSQGACLSLEFAARRGGRLGGVVALSGGLIGTGDRPGREAPDDKEFVYPRGLADTPFFVGCSDVDFHIPLVRVEDSARILSEAGARVTKRIYPGMGHTVNADEIQHARALVSGLVGGTPVQ